MATDIPLQFKETPPHQRPLRVALVGYGYFARFHLDAWCRLNEVTPVAIVEPNQERRKAACADAAKFGITLCAYADIESLEAAHKDLALDIIDIATPPPTHVPLITTLLDCADTLICQKPFCNSVAEAENLVAHLGADAQRVIIHENFRFQPWYSEIKSLMDTKRLGNIVQAEFRFRPGDGAGDDAYLARQPYFRTMERFLIRETGVHYVDVFRYLFGEPTSVFAHLHRSNPVIAGEDSGLFGFTFQNGTRALFNANRTLDHAAENGRLTMGEMIIEGTEAELRLSGNGTLSMRDRGSTTWQTHPYAFTDRNFGGDCVFLFQRAMCETLAVGDRPVNTAIDYLTNLHLQDAIYAASDSGCQMEIG